MLEILRVINYILIIIIFIIIITITLFYIRNFTPDATENESKCKQNPNQQYLKEFLYFTAVLVSEAMIWNTF